MHRRCAPADIAARGWNLLAGDLPLPLAALDRDALAHNIRWMQAYARGQGVDLAPHGKTTMSPQLFQRQLDAGAWGITFANVFQLRVGVAAGVRRALIANQLVQDIELAALQSLRAQHARPARGVPGRFVVAAVAHRGLVACAAGQQRRSRC